MENDPTGVNMITVDGQDNVTIEDMTIDGNILKGDLSTDDNNNPTYAEYNLQISVDISTINGTETANVLVKEGFAGAIESVLDDLLDHTGIARAYLDELLGGFRTFIELDRFSFAKFIESKILRVGLPVFIPPGWK